MTDELKELENESNRLKIDLDTEIQRDKLEEEIKSLKVKKKQFIFRKKHKKLYNVTSKIEGGVKRLFKGLGTAAKNYAKNTEKVSNQPKKKDTSINDALNVLD